MSKRNDENIGDQVLSKAHDIGDELSDIAAIVRDAVDEKFHELAKLAAQTGRQSRDKALEVRDDVAGYVGESPLQSVLLAAAIGFILGRVTTPRSGVLSRS